VEQKSSNEENSTLIAKKTWSEAIALFVTVHTNENKTTVYSYYRHHNVTQHIEKLKVIVRKRTNLSEQCLID